LKKKKVQWLLCSRGSTKQNDRTKIIFPSKTIKKIQKSGDGTLLEIKFEEFLQIFVHFGNKKMQKEKNKKQKKTLRGKTITAPPGR